jgi:hypothetical protein
MRVVYTSEPLEALMEPAEGGANDGHLAPLGQVGSHLLHMGDELFELPSLSVQDLDEFIHHSGKLFDIHGECLPTALLPRCSL